MKYFSIKSDLPLQQRFYFLSILAGIFQISPGCATLGVTSSKLKSFEECRRAPSRQAMMAKWCVTFQVPPNRCYVTIRLTTKTPQSLHCYVTVVTLRLTIPTKVFPEKFYGFLKELLAIKNTMCVN